MSKIIELIHATPTQRRASYSASLLDSVASVKESYIPVGTNTEYKITAELGDKVWVSEEAASNGGLELAVRHVKRSVAEAIFGEFRESIHGIRQALWNRDYENADRKLSNLERQMFSHERA